jgi:hypothetical protein
MWLVDENAEMVGGGGGGRILACWDGIDANHIVSHLKLRLRLCDSGIIQYILRSTTVQDRMFTAGAVCLHHILLSAKKLTTLLWILRDRVSFHCRCNLIQLPSDQGIWT